MSDTNGMLAYKTVMITGASSGIGEAAARLFAAEGAAVLLMARREDLLKQLAQEINESGGRAAISTGDVSIAQDVQRAVDASVEHFGTLDAAFNNAGFSGADLSPMHELDQAIFDRSIAVNVNGTWNCLRSQIPVMLAAGKGAIVNTSSTAAVGATGAPVPYVAAKHAVLGMTRAAAAEYAEHNIRINSLVVGTTRSEMISQAVEAYPELETAFISRQMQKRMADPVEIAQAALWLCSDRASFATGSALAVDGGWTAG